MTSFSHIKPNFRIHKLNRNFNNEQHRKAKNYDGTHDQNQ